MTPCCPKVDSLPGLENLPKPAEVVEKAFDLSSVLLASAKNVAVEATKAFTPKAAPGQAGRQAAAEGCRREAIAGRFNDATLTRNKQYRPG